MSYRVAIVGCGSISHVHAQSLKGMNNVELVACADIRPERSQAFAEQYGCKAYNSFEEMLDNEKLDVVHICTPHALHVPMVTACADRGIHAFCEKPAACDQAQLEALKEACKKVHVGICFQNRFNDNIQYVLKDIASGVSGKIQGVRANVSWKRDESYYVTSGWRGTKELECGSALINQSIHTLDLITVLLGDPKRVEATMANHHLKGVIETEDTVEAWIDFGDTTAIFYATTANFTDAPVVIEVYGENKNYRLEGSTDLFIQEKDEKYKEIDLPGGTAYGKTYWGVGHPIAINNFYNSLTGEKEYYVSNQDVERTMKLMFAVYESADKLQMIDL